MRITRHATASVDTVAVYSEDYRVIGDVACRRIAPYAGQWHTRVHDSSEDVTGYNPMELGWFSTEREALDAIVAATKESA